MNRRHKLKRIEARHIGYAIFKHHQRDFARGAQQCKFFYLLLRRKQITFDPIRKKLKAFGIDRLLLSRKSALQPLRQARAVNRCGFNHRRHRFQRHEPFRLFALPVNLRQQHQCHCVIGQPFAILCDRFRPVLARLARRDTQFEQSLRGKQRKCISRRAQLTPIKSGLRIKHLALDVTGSPCKITQGVGSLERCKRLRTVNRIELCGRFWWVLDKLFGGETHQGMVNISGGGSRSRRGSAKTQ